MCICKAPFGVVFDNFGQQAVYVYKCAALFYGRHSQTIQ
jgi:hypothetical protein